MIKVKTIKAIVFHIAALSIAIGIATTLVVLIIINTPQPTLVYQFDETECKFKKTEGTLDKSITIYECVILGNGFLDWIDKDGNTMKEFQDQEIQNILKSFEIEVL